MFLAAGDILSQVGLDAATGASRLDRLQQPERTDCILLMRRLDVNSR